MTTNTLRPVHSYFPDRTARWVADFCRAGRLPGALKVGRVWMVSDHHWQAFVNSTLPRTPLRIPTVEEAAEEEQAVKPLEGI